MASHNDIVQPLSAPATVPAAQLAFMKKPNGKTATDAPFGTSTANKPQQHPCLHASRLSRPLASRSVPDGMDPPRAYAREDAHGPA